MRCKMANLSLLMENYFMEEDSKNIKKRKARQACKSDHQWLRV